MDVKQNDMAFESRFTVGGAFSKTASTLLKNPAVFLALTAVSTVISDALTFMLPKSPASMANAPDIQALFTLVILGFVALFIYLACIIAIQGAMAYAVYRTLTGGKSSIMESVTRALARLVQLVLVSLMYTVGVTFAAFLMLLPAIMLICRWSVSAPACLVEGLGARKSLARSAYLTKGHRWKILGILTLTGLAFFVINRIVTLIITPLALGTILSMLIHGILLLVPTAFHGVVTSVIYYDLRSVKEGLTIDNLSNVFD